MVRIDAQFCCCECNFGGSFALGGEGIGLGGEDSLSEADIIVIDVIIIE